MGRYLISIYRPNGYDGGTESAEMREEISALNREMVAAGVRVLVGGLHGPERGKAIRRNDDGDVIVTDGPYVESREFVSGLWVLELESHDAAVEWGRKAAAACRCPVEVRPFH